MHDVENELANLKEELRRRDEAMGYDLAIARRVQLSMIPQPVRHSRIDIDVMYVPLEAVGGDYCQVLFPCDDCCYITMCDVEGHGIGAALMATRVSSEVRRCVLQQLAPEEVVRQLNTFVFDNFSDAELFLTFFVTRFDFSINTLTYSGAGHPGPVLIRRGSTTAEVLRSQNIPIGIRKDSLAENSSDRLDVNCGDRLILFTDGVTESLDNNGNMLGVEGITELATSTCDDALFDMAECFLKRLDAIREGPQVDDMTLIIAELK